MIYLMKKAKARKYKKKENGELSVSTRVRKLINTFAT